MLSALILPVFFGLHGIWLEAAAATVFACVMSVAFLLRTESIRFFKSAAGAAPQNMYVYHRSRPSSPKVFIRLLPRHTWY